ncbi:MAG: hypothetical protein PSN37_04875 [Alphaproteobacteria bacterium]|nr:hypothetical protein [Alphaproteobacteria bacterium]
MIEVMLRDGVYFLTLAVGIAGSHFMLRAKVMVLEERIAGYYAILKGIFSSLQRIESKLDKKVDKSFKGEEV